MNPDIKISVHDKYQVEFKIVYPIEKTSRVNDYFVDAFFFLPRNLSVNSQTYTGREFYNDLSEYLRFKTPSVSLKNLAKDDTPPLVRLSGAIDALPRHYGDYNRHLKMFCSIVRSALKHNADRILALYPEEQLPELTDYLEYAKTVLRNYRQLRHRLGEHAEALELFDLVDEFLSITLNSGLYKLGNSIEGHPLLADIRKQFISTAYGEIQYRKLRNCPSVPDPSKDNSELLYRESTLKKAMGDILFLSTDTRKDGIWRENLLLGLAAAVAMIFVTAIAFIWRGLFLEEFSISFFIVWVIAYMFKDRIKSQLQLYCLNRRSHYAYDYRQKIRDGLGNVIGFCREGFRHCNGRDLNDKLTVKRNRTTLSRLEDGSLNENVIVYRKKIEVFGNSCKDIFREFDVDGVVNIYRMNIRHWLYKMDNPERTVFYSDGSEIQTLRARRDYHVNIVLRYGEKGGEEQYVRYRLVLCRNGIRKLEHFA